jgi:glycosyltransferase involved in cell wall biosynthesis
MKGLPSIETVNGVTVRRVPCWRAARHYTNAIELATTLGPTYFASVEMIQQARPDVLHAHFVFPTGVAASALSRRFGIPLVLTAHGSDIPRYNPDRFGVLHATLRPLWRHVVRRATAVTTASQFLAALMHRALDVPVTVIPNAYSPDAVLGRVKRPLVLVVARLFPRKGVHHFIESILPLRTDWEFLVAGDGPSLEVLKRQARAARVKLGFAGFVDRATLRGLYEEASIFVFPSIRENFPMVLLEAMDAGCAVITTDAEGCAEVVGDAGIVVAKGDTSAMRSALVSLMHDVRHRAELSQRAVERAQLFRWSRIASLYREVFVEAAHRPVLSGPALPAPARR